MNRQQMIDRVFNADRDDVWDIAIIGGGATGVGIAVDAASRGYRTVLLEQSDFGKGTSSRSTKLAHGGVRYLQQGNVSLVMQALKERGLMRRNAPHLVHDLAFIVPNYDWWEAPFYGIGMKVYDLLAGRYGFGRSRLLSRDKVLERIPALEQDGLRGGVLYYDGQFDDARLLVHLAATAAEHDAALLNYTRVADLTRDADGFINGLIVHDLESNTERHLRARCVVNATGAFTDAIIHLDEPDAAPMIAPSQGVHLVLDRSFLGGDAAIMVPRTRDGRVMFAIPWHDHTLLGTTDTPIDHAELEPRPLAEEVDFILDTAGEYLERRPTRADVLSAWAGIRPLVKAGGNDANTAALSRDHTIHIAASGLLTIAGGKWTTYRHMAEDCVDQAATIAHLDERPCPTKDLHIHGYQENVNPIDPLSCYGCDAPAVRDLAKTDPALAKPLHNALPITGAQIIWAARHEMARTLDDALARRTRALTLNAEAALAMAPAAAKLMATELHRDESWQREQIDAFTQLAEHYRV